MSIEDELYEMEEVDTAIVRRYIGGGYIPSAGLVLQLCEEIDALRAFAGGFSLSYGRMRRVWRYSHTSATWTAAKVLPRLRRWSPSPNASNASAEKWRGKC